MFYKYSDTAGHYGAGSWVVFSVDCFGMKSVRLVCTSEEEAKKHGEKYGE